MEEFTEQLYRELKSTPQPCLVPFLKVRGRLCRGMGGGALNSETLTFKGSRRWRSFILDATSK